MTIFHIPIHWFFTYPIPITDHISTVPAVFAIPILLGLPYLLESLHVFQECKFD